jgi:Predicted acyl-CoA transferases/carnitine dehydratase
MSITGLPGQGPVRVGVPIDDLTAGLFTAIGILLALIERQRSGRGQWVHSSLLQAQIAMLDYQAARWLISGEVPGQAGNNHPMAITTGLFQTADEPINVCADPQPIWERFCRAVEGEDLRADPRFASDELRTRNGAAVVEAMTAKLKQRKGREWIEILNRAGVPSGTRQPHRPGLRRPAGAAFGHGAPGHPSHPRRHRSGGPAGDPGAHAQPHEPCGTRARQCDGRAAPGPGLRQ